MLFYVIIIWQIANFLVFGCGFIFYFSIIFYLESSLQTPMQTPIQTPLPGMENSLYQLPSGSNDFAPMHDNRGAVDVKSGRPSPYMVYSLLISSSCSIFIQFA